MKLKLIKVNTVLIRRPCLTRTPGIIKLVPLISFSGLVLNDYGFEVGKSFEVYGQKDQLVLEAKGFKYENSIIKKGGKR